MKKFVGLIDLTRGVSSKALFRGLGVKYERGGGIYQKVRLRERFAPLLVLQ